MPTKMLAKGLTVPASAMPRRAVKLAPEGIVVAIVAVTGVVDEVEDLIVPGAFAHTLKVRRPKVVDDHEWKNKVGRVLHVEEWLPGDRRLPKLTKDGKPWPAAAGALVATMQYNLRAARGAEAYEWVRFYAESNEAEFSIGYKAVKARKRADGVRIILVLNLFEFSHVLFGAAPLSMALEVKGMHSGTAGTVTKPATMGADDEAASYDDVDTPNPDRPWDDDEDDKAPMEAKTAASVLLEAKGGGWDRNRGNAENLRHWYVAGEGAALIGWGASGDFDRCVAIAGKHMTLEDAKGYCNLRHHEALGIYPATHAAMEGKTAPTTEGKAMSRMKGSYEERIALLEAAASDLLATTLDRDDVCAWPVATYATEAVFTVHGPDGEESYLIGYEVDEQGGVSLAEPQRVELNLVAVPETAAEAVALDGDDVLEGEAVTTMVVDAAMGPIARLAGTEGKAAALLLERLSDLVESKTYTGDPEPDADDEEDATDEDADYDADDEESMVGEDDETLFEETAEAPAEDLEDDTEEKISLDPDEHFATMDDLDSVDTDTPDDDEDEDPDKETMPA